MLADFHTPLLYLEDYSKLETIIGQRVIQEDQPSHICLEEAAMF